MVALFIFRLEEWFEEVLLIFFCDSDSLINYAYIDHPLLLVAFEVCKDTYVRAIVWEFDAVGQQVEKDLL